MSKVLKYRAYEEEVYNWLMAKHQSNPEFTFSLRQMGSKGAELDYFIGTSKSNYFGTTFWTLPVSFPGSSGDCIDLIIKISNKGFSYYFEFTQTKAPHDEQNTLVLEFIQSLESELESSVGLKFVTGDEHKMFGIKTKPTQEYYANLNEMLLDVGKQLDIILELVDRNLVSFKTNHPSFVMHRITKEEFDSMLERKDKRFLKYEDINSDMDFEESDSNIDFNEVISKMNATDLENYFNYLRKLLSLLGIKSSDKRIVFSVRENRLNFIIGQRYCWNLFASDARGNYGVISTQRINESSSQFNGKEPTPFYTQFDSFDIAEMNFDNVASQLSIELERASKSSFRKWNNIDFENLVFNIDSSNTNFTNDYKAPINQILYGPPGTGKTYNTVLEAAKIVTGNENISYDEALKVFNENLHNQIEFITFHQNYSYEDFIQGLRPDTENGNSLTFEKKDGVFKRIADRALKNLEAANKAPDELSNETMFEKALEIFKDSILDTEDKYQINEAVYIFEVDDEAFRYTGSNWEKHANGIRMKFADLKEFYRNNVRTRKDIKSLDTISGLANQHATYYLLVYEAILKFLPTKLDYKVEVDRKNYVIIIDEINRANISRVFGELITLIEEDKRSHGKIPMRVSLPSGDSFTVPSNLYIIGTMNTADKSISLLDIALRRRFEFIPMYPDSKLVGDNSPTVLETINKEIVSRKGYDFTIGHAYFMGEDYTLEKTINNKVIPLLLEYFMNDEKEVATILKAANIETEGWPMKLKTV